eukprot:3838718-Pyramimonas_sp.AAC.1
MFLEHFWLGLACVYASELVGVLRACRGRPIGLPGLSVPAHICSERLGFGPLEASALPEPAAQEIAELAAEEAALPSREGRRAPAVRKTVVLASLGRVH